MSATISAKDVKELRDRTGAGMMDCKKALEETDGDIDKAIEILRVPARRRPPSSAAARPPRARSSATSTPTARSACSSRSTATPTSSPATTTSWTFARDVALHIAAADAAVRLRGRRPRGRQAGRAARSSSSRRPTSPRTCARRSPRASCASGWRTSCSSTRRTSTRTSTTGKTIEQLRAELSGQDGRERRDPPLRALRGRRIESPVVSTARLQAHPAQALGRGAHGRPASTAPTPSA